MFTKDVVDDVFKTHSERCDSLRAEVEDSLRVLKSALAEKVDLSALASISSYFARCHRDLCDAESALANFVQLKKFAK